MGRAGSIINKFSVFVVNRTVSNIHGTKTFMIVMSLMVSRIGWPESVLLS